MWLDDEKLKIYRAWKSKIKTSLDLATKPFLSSIRDGHFERLFENRFRPIFVCGISGSGTTLLSSLMDQNYINDICIHESSRDKNTSLLFYIRKARTYKNIDEYTKSLYLPSELNHNTIKTELLRYYRRLVKYPRKSSLVIDKAPNTHLVRIGMLMDAFPDAKSILIYRDPVEVIEGLRRKWKNPFGNASFSELCRFWTDLHVEFLNSTRNYRERVFIVSYTQLITNPEKVLSRIAKFAGFIPRIIPTPYEDKKNIPGKGLRNVSGGKIQVLPHTTIELSDSISYENQQMIRAICSGTLNEIENLNTINNES
jgi:hypothetical protein